MGMAVKGPVEHRLIRRAIHALLNESPPGALTPLDVEACKRLRARADRGIDRITAKRVKRDLRQREIEGYGHGV